MPAEGSGGVTAATTQAGSLDGDKARPTPVIMEGSWMRKYATRRSQAARGGDTPGQYSKQLASAVSTGCRGTRG
jgi:hypothetical protein